MEKMLGELYTTTEIVYEISKDNALNQIVNGEVYNEDDDIGGGEELEEVLPEPEPRREASPDEETFDG